MPMATDASRLLTWMYISYFGVNLQIWQIVILTLWSQQSTVLGGIKRPRVFILFSRSLKPRKKKPKHWVTYFRVKSEKCYQHSEGSLLVEARKGKFWKDGIWGHGVAGGGGEHRGQSGGSRDPGEHLGSGRWARWALASQGVLWFRRGQLPEVFEQRGGRVKAQPPVEEPGKGPGTAGGLISWAGARWGRGTGRRLFWRRHWAGHWLNLARSRECEETLSFRGRFKVPVCGLETGEGPL